MKKWYRKGYLKRSGKRSLALLLSVCLIGTMTPVTARAESGSTNTGLCEHHTEHTNECGYIAPTEGQECSHVHDESCGYQEAGECTHVHTEECGENGENCAHEHTSECGYAEGHACEHVHDEECGYAESSVGSPCTYVCDICGEEVKLDEKIGTNENLSEQTVGKLIAAETYKVVSSNILSEYNTSFEEVDDRGNLCSWNDASWEQTNIPRRAYGEAAKPSADCGDYYVQANPANIGDKAQCQIGGEGIAALIKGGNTYEYSYYAKLAEEEWAGGVTLSVIGDWSTCAEITPDKEVTLNEYEWQKVTGTFTLASDASSIIVVRFEGTEGVAYCIDDLRIGNTASLTDQSGTELTGNDWWAQSVTFTAPDGFTISDNLTGTYESFFTYDTQTSAEGATVTYYLKNSDGEIAEKTAIVHIDKTVPNWNGDNCGISIKENWWKLLLENISFCMFYKETVDVKVCASDSLSGVAAYYYYIDSTGGTVKTAEQLDALNFTKYTGSVSGQNPTVTVTSLAPDGNYIVYAYAVDVAGNRSAYVCSEGVVVDSTAPAISNIVAPSKEASTLTDTTATISFTGSEAGTYFYMIKESSETAPTTITDFATEQANDGYSTWTANANISSATMTADADNKITLSDLTANTEYALYIAAVDQAGNSIQTIASQSFTTCKTMPKVADADMPKISGTYGQKVAEMTLTNGVAKVGSEEITGTWELTDGNKTNVPAVGTTDTYQVTFTPADTYSDIYDTVIVTVKPTVSKRAITVTIDDKTKTYGQANPELTYAITEGTLVGTDTVEALGITLSCAANESSPVKAGGYAITGTSNSANYEVTVNPGILTINKADAQITIDTGKDSYSKTFGDAAFTLSGISDTNTDANVQYAVTAGEDVVSVSNGTVTILKAGTATITVSLPASTNYNAADSKTITVNVAKKSGYTVADINKSYLYSRDNAENIDLSKYLPSNCGTVSYGTPQVSGELYTDGGQPIVSADGKLSYTVKTGSVGDTGTIQVTVTTDNYADFTITVKVELTDKLPVSLSGVACGNRVYNAAAYVYTGTPVWKTEDGTAVTGETSVTYQKAGETLEKAPTDAGSYRAEFTIASDDYVGTESYSFEITKAEITVAAKNKSIYVGDAVPNLTTPVSGTDYSVTGLCGTDALGGTAAMSYGQEPDNTKDGTYEILIGGLTAPEGDNYTITFTNGTLTITTKPSGGSTGGGSSSGGSTGEVTTGKDSGSNDTTTTSPTDVKVENGTASATVKAENVTEAIKQAADNKSAELVFTVSEKDTGNADKIQLTMTTSDVKQILDKTDADLVVATTAGDVILPQEALIEAVSAAGGNDITIEIEKVTTPTAAQKEAAGENSYIVEVTIASQNKAITTFGGHTLKIRLEIPAALAGKDVAVIYIAEDGKTEKMPGKTVTEGTKQYYEFTTTHLSTFALVDGSIIEEETPAVTAPKKGTLLTDSKTKMVYKVTKSGTTGGTVQFVKTKNTKAKTIAIPDKVTIDGITYKVTSIAANALKNNKTVTTVTIGKYVTSIGSNAFYGCSKLKKVTIGKSVTTIGSKAFYKCTSLTSITIPSKVTKIGNYAFKGCTKLKTINLNTTLLTSETVSQYAFSGVSTSAVVKVPKSKNKKYKKLLVKKGLSKKVTVKGL